MLRSNGAASPLVVALLLLGTTQTGFAQSRAGAVASRGGGVPPGDSRGSTMAVHQLEQVVGEPLTSKQEAEVEQAVSVRNAAIRAAMEQFYESIARVVGMTAQELQQKAASLTPGNNRPSQGDGNSAPAPAANNDRMNDGAPNGDAAGNNAQQDNNAQDNNNRDNG